MSHYLFRYGVIDSDFDVFMPGCFRNREKKEVTTEQDPRLTRAAQLRADAKTLSLAALVRERSESLGICLPSLLWDDSAKLIREAAALEKEVQAEIDAKAAAEVDEWAEVKRVVDHILSNRSQYLSSEICVAKYVSHLQGRVTELENDECERINNRIAALDAEIAGLRAENERLKGGDGRAAIESDLKENFSLDEGKAIDGLLYDYERDGRVNWGAAKLYVKAAVHYRRKYRDAEAKLAAVPKLWMSRNRNSGSIVGVLGAGYPTLYLNQAAAVYPNGNTWEAIPYDGRKGVAP